MIEVLFDVTVIYLINFLFHKLFVLFTIVAKHVRCVYLTTITRTYYSPLLPLAVMDGMVMVTVWDLDSTRPQTNTLYGALSCTKSSDYLAIFY